MALAAVGASHAADVAGKWQAEFDTLVGVQKYTYTLKLEGDKLTGKAASDIGGQKRETEMINHRLGPGSSGA